ncbi:helix-turn-helix domain-containing protein [Pedobacter punctiformis]|uniref:Helix-turn-helix domain-containing protein n=1 Tax=Pedobacter punctiformis TaxID=3004097 RepID=A0ABT4LD61_9SPHI|nr:helix-turn-helix domain-containing protein [Pedobacter sp. HCMS5-2]MCZ4245840.1 helix-turn-helix domain-containing protein [Pedobacter sp. HCMS5-2]
MNELMLTSIKKEELSALIENSVRKVLSENPASTNENPSPDFLTIDEASKFLNLAKATVYTLTSAGKIPVIKKGKRLYFTKQELMNWLKKGRKKTIEEIEEEAASYVLKNRFYAV